MRLETFGQSVCHMISRRSALSWLGVSAAGASALNAFPAFAKARPVSRMRVLSLESFCVSDAGPVTHLRSYIADALLPCMKQMRASPRMCLEGIVAPHTPQTLLLAVYSSFSEMLEERARIASDPRVLRARAEIESAQVLDDVRSHLLIGSEESVRFPAQSALVKSGLFEVRTWHAPAWLEGPPSEVSSVLNRIGIHPIVAGATAAGEHLPRFTYIVPFDSLVARQQAWTRLDGDAQWMEMQRESIIRYGSGARRNSNRRERPSSRARRTRCFQFAYQRAAHDVCQQRRVAR
jgi:NIPSNAP